MDRLTIVKLDGERHHFLHHLLLDIDAARADRFLAALGAWDDAASGAPASHRYQDVYDRATSIAHRYRSH